jgi:AbrB family looped-hinge helix DNA binding protein
MTATLSSKGQVVLPKQARTRLHLHPGTRLVCKIEGDSIVLTRENPLGERPKLVTDPKTGLRITKSPTQTKVTNEDVRAAMIDFP